MFKFKNIKYKLQFYFQMIGMIPMLMFGTYDYYTSKDTIISQSKQRVTSLREVRKKQIEDYINQSKEEVIYFAKNRFFIDAAKDLILAYNNYNPDSTERALISGEVQYYYENNFMNRLSEIDRKEITISKYIPRTNPQTQALQYHYIVNQGESKLSKNDYFNVHEKYFPLMKEAMDRFKYYDIFIMDNDGNITFTVAKEPDFATNVKDNMISNTNLAKIYVEFKNKADADYVAIYDYEAYLASAYEPAIFIASNFYDNGRKIGTLIIQLSVDDINALMTGDGKWKEDGLGQSGETFIVGKDSLMRTESRSFLEEPKSFYEYLETSGKSASLIDEIKYYKTCIMSMPVKSVAVKKAMQGLSGEEVITDYRGLSALASYSPVDIADLKWNIVSKIDEDELLEPVKVVRYRAIIAQFIVFILISLIANFVASSISKPMFKLSAASQEVSKGNLDVKTDIKTGDEIEDLSNAFNKMVSDVKNEKNSLQLVMTELESGKSELEKQATILSKLNQDAEIQKIQVEAKNRELETVLTTVNAQKSEMERQAFKINQSFEETQSLVKQLDEEKNFIVNQNREFEANSKVLMNLAKSKNVQQGNFETSLREIAQKTSLSLDITQVGIWELNETYDALKSLAVFNKENMKFMESTTLYQKDFPIYFQSILSGDPINAQFAETDLNTSEFAEVYLKPNNIKSMFDVPYFIDGIVRGVICCEHKYEHKEFGLIETNFTKSAADILTIAYKSFQRKEAEVRIKEQSEVIEEKNRDIIASINYAKRIQAALLPTDEHIKSLIPNHFIYYKPKDIISGDFYWIDYVDNKIIIVIADCTGHGVPGAFMTMIGDNQLDQIIREKKITSPDLILTVLHHGVAQSLKQNENDIKDGMDVGIVVIDHKTKKMSYAGAMNPLYYVQNNTFFEIKADKRPIGGRTEGADKVSFTKHEIDISTPTTFYICTDGYQDQFGGPDKRKYMVKRMKEMLFAGSNQPILTQKQLIADSMKDWMGYENPQVDDMIVFGATV